ncbi:MAG TPA: Flp pilus assembly protein CpaB [Candidatus Aquilonibacter sp.]|nr:Flp pilus assembly protein CpaB [Candidatus Aquilonibacter sp.]
MNRTRLLMIGVLALALGALASVYVYNNLRGNVLGSNEPTVDVLVAADNIQVGARIEDHDVRVAKLPATGLPAGVFTKRSQVLGRGVVVPIASGEFLLPSKLAAENAGAGLPSLIPPGMRAVSVRVNEVVSVAGFVGPGTRVDVLLTGTPAGSSESQTTTVLQNVAVIAAGHTLERNAAGEAQNTPVITLLVSPDDAERLALASSQGHIQLALRNPLDTREDDLPAAAERALYKGVNAAPTATAPAPVHVHTVRQKAAPPPPAPNVLSVEVYEGDKKMPDMKFPEQGGDDAK